MAQDSGPHQSDPKHLGVSISKTGRPTDRPLGGKGANWADEAADPVPRVGGGSGGSSSDHSTPGDPSDPSSGPNGPAGGDGIPTVGTIYGESGDSGDDSGESGADDDSSVEGETSDDGASPDDTSWDSWDETGWDVVGDNNSDQGNADAAGGVASFGWEDDAGSDLGGAPLAADGDAPSSAPATAPGEPSLGETWPVADDEPSAGEPIEVEGYNTYTDSDGVVYIESLDSDGNVVAVNAIDPNEPVISISGDQTAWNVYHDSSGVWYVEAIGSDGSVLSVDVYDPTAVPANSSEGPSIGGPDVPDPTPTSTETPDPTPTREVDTNTEAPDYQLAPGQTIDDGRVYFHNEPTGPGDNVWTYYWVDKNGNTVVGGFGEGPWKPTPN